ncbi:hypothetical protein M9458_004979, partial [Cirrhinus mrigala]
MYSVHRQKKGIYANIRLFLSYSEDLNHQIQSSSGSSPDDLYSTECQRRPHRLDEPQRRIPSEDLVTYTAVGTGPWDR